MGPKCAPHEPGKVSTVILPDEGVERYFCCGHRSAIDGLPIPTRKMGLRFMLKEPGRRRAAKLQWRAFVRNDRFYALPNNFEGGTHGDGPVPDGR